MPLSNAFGKEIFRAKVAVPGNNEATIIPLGASAATQRPYKYALDGMQLQAGDDVYVIPISGTYVLLGGAVAGGGGGLPAGGEAGQALVKASSTDYAVKWATAALHISVASFSSFPQTISNSAITAGMRVVNCVWGTPSAVTSTVTWTTTDGSLTLSGNISGSTTAEIDLILF